MGRISDKLDKDITDHPDTIEVEMAGETLPWFLGRRTFGLVEDHPQRETTFSAILNDAMVAQGDEVDISEQMDKLARVMWAGFLPFEPELEFELVSEMLSFRDLPRLQNVLDRNFGKLQELAEEAEGKFQGEGAETTPTEGIPEAVKANTEQNPRSG